METTKQRIIRLLKTHGGLTSAELATMLDISPTAVRRHLSALEASHAVCHRSEQRGMGRPTYVYELVDSVPQVFKRSYSAFVDTIIQQMKALDGGKKPEELFDRLRETRDQQYIAHTNGETLTDRVACLAQLMESEGRMTTWQQINENQFILREHNCPFYRFNGGFDHPCRGEISLLRKTLKAQVKRVNHILEGDVACVYEIVDQSNIQHVDLGQRGHAAPAKYAV